MNPETKRGQPGKHLNLNNLVPPGKLLLRQRWEKDWRKVPEMIKERKGEKKPKATPHNLKNLDLESKGRFQREQQFSWPQTDPRAISQGL